MLRGGAEPGPPRPAPNPAPGSPPDSPRASAASARPAMAGGSTISPRPAAMIPRARSPTGLSREMHPVAPAWRRGGTSPRPKLSTRGDGRRAGGGAGAVEPADEVGARRGLIDQDRAGLAGRQRCHGGKITGYSREPDAGLTGEQRPPRFPGEGGLRAHEGMRG